MDKDSTPIRKKIRVSVPKLGETIKEVRYEEDADALHFYVETESVATETRIVRSRDASESFAQLLGRALARTRVDDLTNSSWSFLGAQDFEKTGKQDLGKTLPSRLLFHIRSIAPERATTILFTQGSDGVSVLGTSSRAETLKRRAESAPDTIRFNIKIGPEVFEAGPFDNFHDAETHMKRVLKDSA